MHLRLGQEVQAVLRGEGAMTIKEYLQGEQAEQEVRALLDQGLKPYSTSYWPSKLELRHINAHPQGPWHEITIHKIGLRYPDAFGYVTTYVRPEDQWYVVTDCGEALVVLRKRTGILHPYEDRVDHGRTIRVFQGDNTLHQVHPIALPRAICNMLLAAYRVANLGLVHAPETPAGGFK